ncbi:hypothetical protein PCANC_27392 [Puccinia coronata f. sp. avenae]|uniref:VWFA domain-containing protein n=1 Tax=Puccinia coronata f. sp. avenae TaxID=200324 RepID=A0A2N5RUL0_9BASI|nr:hypothetical protein PCANC_27392 [Puccinia coronata f. sp. avenae]
MAGMISAFVELPGTSNHEDFKFPWSLDDINHLVSDRKASRQMKKNSHDVQHPFPLDSGLYGKPFENGTPLEPVPRLHNYRETPINLTSGDPSQEQKSTLKKSLKCVTGFMKQKIIDLEEKAASFNYDARPNVADPIQASPGLSSDPVQTNKTKESRTARIDKLSNMNGDIIGLDNKVPNINQRIKALPEKRSGRGGNHEAETQQGLDQSHSGLPPQYYQGLDEVPVEERHERTGRRGALEVSRMRRKEDVKKNQSTQTGAHKPSSSNMPKGMRRKAERTGKTEENSTYHPPTGNRPKVQAPNPIRGKSTPSANKDFKIDDDENLLSTLKRFKTIFLLDDSASMASNGHWEEAIKVLGELVKVASNYDTEGIDVQLLNSKYHFKSSKGASPLLRKFKTIQPTGDSTPTETKLEEILRPYIETLEMQKSKQHPLPKPLNLVIITDGIPDDIDTFISIISHVSSTLDGGHFPLNQIGIQFVQIGSDRRVSRVLNILDNHLQKRYRISRDMIDTTQFSGAMDETFIMKCLLGGINRRVDRMQYSS